MDKRIRSFFSIFSISLISIVLSSCMGSGFAEEYGEYKKIYVSSLEFVASSDHSNQGNVDNLKQVDYETLKKNVESLKQKADLLQSNAKSRYEKHLVSNITSDCSILDELLDIRARIDNLTDDDVWDLIVLYTCIGTSIDEYSK